MIFLTTIPKAGTHLLAKVIESLTGAYPVSVKKSGFDVNTNFSNYQDVPNLVGHFRAKHLRQNDSLRALFEARKTIILVRDPRDICNSMLYYLQSSTNPMHRSILPLLEGMVYSEKIRAIAGGLVSPETGFKVNNLNDTCSGFMEIRKMVPEAVVVKYEDFFVGNLAAKKLTKTLGIDLKTIDRSVKAALGADTKTLRAGIPDAWRSNFDEELLAFMNKTYGGTMARLGYDAT